MPSLCWKDRQTAMSENSYDTSMTNKMSGESVEPISKKLKCRENGWLANISASLCLPSGLLEWNLCKQTNTQDSYINNVDEDVNQMRWWRKGLMDDQILGQVGSTLHSSSDSRNTLTLCVSTVNHSPSCLIWSVATFAGIIPLIPSVINWP